MTQTTAYTVDAFIDDVRDIFDATQDPLAQASGVAERMELLLKTPGWLEERLELPDEGGYGRYDLHLDEEYGHPGGGFWLMASGAAARTGQPAPRPRQRLGGVRRVRRRHQADQVALVLPPAKAWMP